MTRYYMKLAIVLFLEFKQNRTGNVALLFGLMILPILIFVGAGIDYSRAQNALYTLQTAADAAVLAGASLTDVKKIERELEAKAIYAVNIAARPELANTQVTVTVVDNTVVASVSYDSPTTITRLAGIDTITVGAKATAAFVTEADPLDLYFVFDQSESMNIPDLPEDIERLIDGTDHINFWGARGCAFACHDPYRWHEPRPGMSLYEFAQEEGIAVRYDKIKAVISQTSESVLNSVTDDSVRVGLYAFSNTAREVAEPTPDYAAIETAMQNLSVPSTYTRYGVAFPVIASGIQQRPVEENTQKALVLMTDGVRTSFVDPYYSGGPIDVNTCSQFKDVVDTVYVLHIEYPDPDYLANFGNRVRRFVGDVSDNLRACATSPEHYFVATNSAEMIENLRKIAERVLANVNVRLSG